MEYYKGSLRNYFKTKGVYCEMKIAAVGFGGAWFSGGHWAVGCLGSFQHSTALGFSFNYKLITSETCYKSRKSAKIVKPIFFRVDNNM